MFADTETDPTAIDPPDNTGGGGKADAEEEESTSIDPPDNTGGGN